MLAPLPYTKPKAKTPAEARALYEHKLSKQWPFLMRGYDIEDMNDFRKYGTTIREDNKPVVRGITYDSAYFFLHSTCTVRGVRAYIFIHMLHERGSTTFRGLMFEGFSEAYRYAYAHGCKVNKKPELRVDALMEFMSEDMDDIDLFVERISYDHGQRGTHVNSLKNLLNRAK